ncbi:Enoyl-CoA hydratase/isomerase family protein [Moritella viscosa]|uniref:enoyl-CoA hydratase-related protein n=1 Tax=Moritella viscosa TaxID=80854 RepID=UPI000508EC00|nr:enoyl-CoA hydratase-related protein [Moritella viscosa]CED59725.1 enoyl-CoA hydratase/isomerase [Moritella viscosa]SHO02944.1 Enoyl-CoA hydratase/isomerase family protein [Moritella viscosa]SHO20863.1 Enoyl-CoA hydratase/isomerase family protein [Moritella viscosa]
MTKNSDQLNIINAEHLHTAVDNLGVATITLTRTKVRNAFSADTINHLLTTLAVLKHDPTVKILILRAQGEHFSAGADIKWMKDIATLGYQDNLADAVQLAKLMDKLNQFPKPTIALVQGACFGGAIGLVACCDIALATTTAKFCLSEVKIGLIPAVISPYVVAAIGPRQARRYCLTGEVFSAFQGLDYGLIHHIDDDLDALSTPFINAFLSNSPAAMQAAKALIHDITNHVINDTLIADTSQRIAAIRVSTEAQEGLDAFMNKRKPDWLKE